MPAFLHRLYFHLSNELLEFYDFYRVTIFVVAFPLRLFWHVQQFWVIGVILIRTMCHSIQRTMSQNTRSGWRVCVFVVFGSPFECHTSFCTCVCYTGIRMVEESFDSFRLINDCLGASTEPSNAMSLKLISNISIIRGFFLGRISSGSTFFILFGRCFGSLEIRS